MRENISQKWLTIGDVHNQFGLSKSWLYKACAKRLIPFYKPTGRILFLRDELECWIINSKIQTETELTTKLGEK